jgi:hypothetical protein
MKNHFILAVLLFYSSVTFAQKDWLYLKTKKGVSLYQRDYLTKGIKQFRLRTTYKNTTLSSIFAVFRDHESFPEWQTDIREIRNLKKVTDMDNYDYYNIEIPWPFKNRDAVYHQKIYYNHADNSLNLSFTCEPTFAPKHKDRVRMTDAAGSWKFIKKANGEIDVDYQNYSDPVGIPSDVVNLLFGEALFRTIDNLQMQIQKEKYKHVKYSFINE